MRNILILMMIIMSCFAFAAITGGENVTRTLSVSTIAKDGTFTVTYTAGNVTGKWGASVVDTLTGCTINGLSSVNFVLLSDADTSKSYTVKAGSVSTCSFSGDYKFGNLSAVTLPGASYVSVTGITTPNTTCNATTWTPDPSTVCIGTTFTQTSNCNTTRSSTGAKSGCSTTTKCCSVSGTKVWTETCTGTVLADSECAGNQTVCGTGLTLCADNTCKESCSSTPTNNTIWYVIGGVAAVGLLYYGNKKKVFKRLLK